jgi:hypothetical protein
MKTINMKKYIIILTLFLSTYQSFGQQSQESREKIKALKVAFLTQELALSAVEAQKFWPIYHKYEEKLNFCRNKGRSGIKNKIKEVGNVNSLEEAEAKKLVLLKLDLEKEMVSEKAIFVSKIATFLAYKKIMKLYISEREFARKLMKKYCKKRKNKE